MFGAQAGESATFRFFDLQSFDRRDAGSLAVVF
jgi:hypothetical protein